jgi:hypothetical protein
MGANLEKANKETINETTVRNKIAIVSSDNRDLNYIRIHKKNLTRYCQKNGYKYFFHTNERPTNYDRDFDNFPIYWKKLAYVDYYLKHQEKFDYVMWIDTDAFIMKDIKLESIIEHYKTPDSVLFIARDNVLDNDPFNAGVFIVKNCYLGKQFIEDCLETLKTTCKKGDKYDLGIQWAGKCYEQGVMNNLINSKYVMNTCQIPSNIINNTFIPNRNDQTDFIAHFMSIKDGIDSKIKHLE